MKYALKQSLYLIFALCLFLSAIMVIASPVCAVDEESVNINIANTSNGTVELVDTNEVGDGIGVPGFTGYIKITPDEGYQLKTLTVTCESGAVETELDSSKSYICYSFLCPNSDVTITATFEKIVCYIDADGDGVFDQGEGYPSIVAALDADHNGESATNFTVITMIADDTENVTIPGDVENTADDETRYITLDLNGHVLSGDGNGSVITNNGHLNIIDSDKTATHYYTVDANGVWNLNDSNKTDAKVYANLTDVPKENDVIAVNGGAITGGTGAYYYSNADVGANPGYAGGGIFNYSVATIDGINIIGNHLDAEYANDSGYDPDTGTYGAGVFNVWGNITINNSCISGNYAYISGGGVYNCGDGSNFAITDSNISYNTTNDNDGDGDGGGVYSYVGTFTLNNSSVAKNTAGNNGGGIYVRGGEFIADNSLITGNTAYDGAGIHVYGGDFTIRDSEITGNTSSDNGGGVSSDNVGNTLFDGCTISGNTAGGSGGGICFTTKAKCILLATKITANKATDNGSGVYYTIYTDGCFPAGTLITMADGSTKPIEDIAEGDIVKTFDHESGIVSDAKVRIAYKGETKAVPFTLTFDNGKTLSIVDCHDLLEKSTLKYVTLTEADISDYIGKYFYGEDGNWHKLISCTKETTPCEYYSVYTAVHQNCFANGMLSVPDDCDYVLNIYELDENLKADAVQLQADIEEYGLLSFELASEKTGMDEEWYTDSCIKYTYIEVGKGLVTLDYLISLYNTTHEDQEPSTCIPSLAQIPSLTDIISPTTTEPDTNPALDDFDSTYESVLTIGDGTTITGNTLDNTNTSDNAYLANSDSLIKIYGNLDEVSVGVTLANGTGQFTTNGEATDLQYFSSDNNAYIPRYNSDGYLELVSPVCFIDTDGDAVLDDGENRYGFVADALAAEYTGETKDNPTVITMLADDTENVTIPGDDEDTADINEYRYVTIDLNGHVLSGNGTTSVITNNGTLTIKDSNKNNNNAYFTYNSDSAWTYIPDPSDEEEEDAVAFENMENATLTSGETVIAVTGGCITGGSVGSEGRGVYNNTGATFNLNGGYIVGNRCLNQDSELSSYGGGIYNTDTGTITISGGAVCGNSVTGNSGDGHDNYGGGIYSYGKVTITGGSICYNVVSGYGAECLGYGGGVCNYGSYALTVSGNAKISNNNADCGGGVYTGTHDESSSSFTMNGGSITGNTATECGGGIGMNSYCNVKLSGGSITENKAETAGGVESGWNTSTNPCTIGGSLNITGNTALDGTTPSNLYIYKDYIVSISTEKPLTSSALIGVTTQTAPTSGSPVAITSNGSATDLQYFSSDNTSYTVAYNSGSGSGSYLELVTTDNIPTAVSGAKYYASLTLKDNIDVNFKMNGLGEGFDSGNLKVYADGTEITTKYDDTNITGVLKAVAPKNMGNDIHVVVTYNGINVKTFDYSICDYCDYVLKQETKSPYTIELQNLCKATLNYGAYADMYFNDKTSSTVNSGYEIIEWTAVPETCKGSIATNTTIKKATASLTVESEMTLNFKINGVKNLTKDDIKLRIGDTDVTSDTEFTINKLTPSEDQPYTYKISIAGIGASDLYKVYTLTIEGQDNFYITYGPYSYCYYVNTQTTDDDIYTDTLKTLCKAIYNYGEAAQAYK